MKTLIKYSVWFSGRHFIKLFRAVNALIFMILSFDIAKDGKRLITVTGEQRTSSVAASYHTRSRQSPENEHERGKSNFMRYFEVLVSLACTVYASSTNDVKPGAIHLSVIAMNHPDFQACVSKIEKRRKYQQINLYIALCAIKECGG